MLLLQQESLPKMENDKTFEEHIFEFICKEKKAHPYVKNIPEGYKYCDNCELLTPHTLDPMINPSKANASDWQCDVCESKPEGYDNCPNCGWEHDPDRDVLPETIKVKKHTTVCIEKQVIETSKQHAEINWESIEEKCDCPEVVAYPIQNIFNYKFEKVFSMDCYNAAEWSYDIMCPICNEIFEVQDGNC